MSANPKTVFEYLADVPVNERRRLLRELSETDLVAFTDSLFSQLQPHARTVQADIDRLSRKPARLRGLTAAQYTAKSRAERLQLLGIKR